MVVKDRIGRNRYIAFVVERKEAVDHKEVASAILSKASAFGGLGNIRPRVVFFEGNRGILRCSHLAKDKAIELLSSIDEIGGKKVRIKTLSTSGTVKKVKKFLEDYGYVDKRTKFI